MKLYNFPLQPLLRAKNAEEKQDKVKLSILLSKQGNQERLIWDMSERIQKLEQDVVEAAKDGTDAEYLKQMNVLLINLNHQLKVLVEKRKQIQIEVDEQMDTLNSTVKERRTLEQYRERLMKEYYSEARKKEEKVMDDLLNGSLTLNRGAIQ